MTPAERRDAAEAARSEQVRRQAAVIAASITDEQAAKVQLILAPHVRCGRRQVSA